MILGDGTVVRIHFLNQKLAMPQDFLICFFQKKPLCFILQSIQDHMIVVLAINLQLLEKMFNKSVVTPSSSQIMYGFVFQALGSLQSQDKQNEE